MNTAPLPIEPIASFACPARVPTTPQPGANPPFHRQPARIPNRNEAKFKIPKLKNLPSKLNPHLRLHLQLQLLNIAWNAVQFCHQFHRTLSDALTTTVHPAESDCLI